MSTATLGLIPIPENPAVHYVVRGRRIMFDADLARFYGVTTSISTRRSRVIATVFPKDFAFNSHWGDPGFDIPNCGILKTGRTKGYDVPALEHQNRAMEAPANRRQCLPSKVSRCLASVLRSPRAVLISGRYRSCLCAPAGSCSAGKSAGWRQNWQNWK